MRPLNNNWLEGIREYVSEYQKKNGKSPSYRQIQKEMNMSSLNLVQRYVLALERSGQIERTDIGNIQIPSKFAKKGTVMAPLVGDIACGDPTEEVENIQESIELPIAIFGGGELFMLYAKGDSMINAGIEKGDLLVIRKQNNAEDGEIVVALVEGRNTLKRLYHRGGKVILHPENPRYEDIVSDDCEVQGVLVSCIKQYA